VKLFRLLFILLTACVAVLPPRAFAALNAAIVFEVRTTGSDTNGGGFKTGASGTDWSQQNGTQYSVTDGVTAGTTTITSATANFGTDVVGNLIYVSGGTGSVTAGWYEITVRTNSTTITVDRSTGLTAGTGVTLKIGGALLSPGLLGAIMVSGNTAFIKYSASVYAMTSSSNVTGGRFSATLGSASRIVGYDSTRTIANRDANRPTIQCSGSGVTLFTFGNANGFGIENLILDGNNETTSAGISSTAPSGGIHDYRRIKFMNFTSAPSASAANTTIDECEFTANSGSIASPGRFRLCWFHANTATCISAPPAEIIHCLFAGNTGASTDAVVLSNSTAVSSISYCTFDNNGRHGINITASASVVAGIIENCVFTRNGGYGITSSSREDSVKIRNNAYGSGTHLNTSGQTNLASGWPTNHNSGAVTLASGDPYANSASNDFTLTSASTGRAGAFDGIAGITDASYTDPGAVQHQDSGGTSSGPLIRSSGARISP
jgi:hypothetical protein